MASWTDLSGAFGYGTKLTSTQMQQLRDNITALAEGASGHPEIVPAALKVSSQSDSHTGDTDWQYITLTGGAYCFICRTRVSNASCDMDYYSGADTRSHTSYATKVMYRIAASVGYTAYIQGYYLTSSGPLFWIFALLNKKTEVIQRYNTAADHPAYGNGDPSIIQHPFDNYDKEKFQIIVCTLNQEQQKEMNLLAAKAEKDIHDYIRENCSFDFSKSAKWPDDLVTIGINNEMMKIPKLEDALILDLKEK